MKIISIYHRLLLPEEDRAAYDRILACWLHQDSVVVLSKLKYSLKSNTTTIVQAVALDHPEIFWVDYYQFIEKRQLFSISLVFNYYQSYQERMTIEKTITGWKNQIIGHLPLYASAEEKYRLLYDYLSREVSYAERGQMYSHTLLGCVPQFGHSAVCEGIAKCYKYLCNAISLPCVIVTGTLETSDHRAIPHAWNMIPSLNGPKYSDILSPGVFLREKEEMFGHYRERR